MLRYLDQIKTFGENDAELINILNARLQRQASAYRDSVVLFFNNWESKQLFHGYLGNSQP